MTHNGRSSVGAGVRLEHVLVQVQTRAIGKKTAR